MEEATVSAILARALATEPEATRDAGALASGPQRYAALAARVLAVLEQLGVGPAAVERLREELEFERAWGRERGRHLADAEDALDRLRRGHDLLRDKLDAMAVAYSELAGGDADGLDAARARAAVMERVSSSAREAGRWRAIAGELALALEELLPTSPPEGGRPTVREALARYRLACG